MLRLPSSEPDCTELLRSFGCSVSHVLFDPGVFRFFAPTLDGVIAYRTGIRCGVGIGDPICPGCDVERLRRRFEAACVRRGWSTVFAAASESFTHACVDAGYAAIEFAEDLIFDPRRDPLAGGAGRELRKNLNRAARARLAVAEHRGCDPGRERELDAVAHAWLASRHGPQAYISGIHLFSERRFRRWFYAHCDGEAMGVLSLVRVDARAGWVFEHLISRVDAPAGTSESLVVAALHTLGDEGCSWVTFGPSPLPRLGRMRGVGHYGQTVGRAFFDAAARFLHFDSVAHYRRKFQCVGVEPRWLLFHPPRVGIRQATALMRAFNVSWKW
jgi:lysylphosphatidylglycerol synthetase-like protein (DUF2156 family)